VQLTHLTICEKQTPLNRKRQKEVKYILFQEE